MTIDELIKKLESIREKCPSRGAASVEAVVLDPNMVVRGCQLQPFFDANMARINIYTPDAISRIKAAQEQEEKEND